MTYLLPYVMTYIIAAFTLYRSNQVLHISNSFTHNYIYNESQSLIDQLEVSERSKCLSNAGRDIATVLSFIVWIPIRIGIPSPIWMSESLPGLAFSSSQEYLRCGLVSVWSVGSTTTGCVTYTFTSASAPPTYAFADSARVSATPAISSASFEGGWLKLSTI